MIHSKKVFQLIIILQLLGTMVTSIEGFAQLPTIRFETITVREGLPSNTILTATRDKSGFMWFGSRLCPIRYNGSAFQSFIIPETNIVDGIVADHANNIWMSTDLNGVCKIEANSLKISTVEGTKDAGQTGDFFIDHNGKGWYSDRFGVNRIDLATGKIKKYPLRQTTFVWTKAFFIEDENKVLWVVGKDNGLFRYDPKKDKLTCILGTDSKDPERKKEILFSKACLDDKGFIWLGSYNSGLIKFNPQTYNYEVFNPQRMGNLIGAVEKGYDENGKPILWVGDKEGIGVFRFNEEKFYFFSDVFPEPFEVNDIYRDTKEGIVWFCTSSGIVKYHPKSNLIQSVDLPNGIVPFPVTINCFLQDKNDPTGMTYYLGLSHSGMIKWKRNLNTFDLISYPSAEAETRWMTQREDGTIWIGSNKWDYLRPGIFVYDPLQERFIQTPLSKLANNYFSVPFFMYGTFDKNNRLWIGNSDEGLRVLDEKTNEDVTPWDTNTQKALLKENNLINDIIIGKRGEAYIATYKGIYLANEAQRQFVNIDSLNAKNYLKDPAVNSLLQDHEGDIWGARWGGISQMSDTGKEKTTLTTGDGFFDRECHGLFEDYKSRIWIGNYEGLYCFDPNSKKLIRFTVNDGLINNNTVDRVFGSVDKKELFIGQKNGFNLIKINQLLKPASAPLLAISSFKIHEKEYQFDYSKPIILNRFDNAISIDFIALNYRKQQDNQYAYYLDGLDENWIHSGVNHLVYYTNLSPGNYTLHLKAGDAFGNWNNKTMKLQITVKHAFYETWWFKTIIVLMVSALLYLLYLYRVNQLLQLERVRTRISADLHDELGSSLSGISIMGTLAKNQMVEKHPSTQFVERIVEEVQQMSSSLDDIVWNISPKNDELIHLLARMRRYASELFEARQINYELNIPEGLQNIKLSMDQRRNFYMIFKESVNNLVKYSKCTKATINVGITNKSLFLTIKDNGIGFDNQKQSDRNGLKNIRSRTKTLKGTIEINSNIGDGTEIKLTFPIK